MLFYSIIKFSLENEINSEGLKKHFIVKYKLYKKSINSI